MSGVSGGGWIVVGAANLLAKENDLSKIKAVFVQTGMISNLGRDIPEDKLEIWETGFGSTPAMN